MTEPTSPAKNKAQRGGTSRAISSRNRKLGRVIDLLVYLLSGEFFLKRRPNGGVVVFQRAAWVTVLVYIAALSLKERLPLDATFRLSFDRLRLAILDTLPWFGAIFAGSYVAFYTRFQSQYAYIAELYNQIMSTHAQAPLCENNEHVYAAWQAGFIEDVDELHLATKPVFASVILSFVEQAGVPEAFAESTPGGAARLEEIVERAKGVLREAS